MKKYRIPLIIFLAILIAYGAICIFHPMPYIFKLDIQSVEITDRNDVIINKSEDPKIVDNFINLFKYNTTYNPWQQNNPWKSIPKSIKSLPPDIGVIFKNDLGEPRFSFYVRLTNPTYTEMRSGFFMPWSKTVFPANPKLANWQNISQNK